MNHFQLVDKNRHQVNQVGDNGWTTTGPLKSSSFAAMQSMAFYWRMHGVKVYLKAL